MDITACNGRRDTQHNGIQHNDTQHNGLSGDDKHVTINVTLAIVSLSGILPNVTKLSVVMPSVAVP
jgi:hypothetical protein